MASTYLVPMGNRVAQRRFTSLETLDAGSMGKVDIRLYRAVSTDQVYWSQQHNSYVVNDNPTGFWTNPDGTPCDLLSINGGGEIRWAVSSEKGNTSGDVDAAKYFGLTWHGWRSQ